MGNTSRPVFLLGLSLLATSCASPAGRPPSAKRMGGEAALSKLLHRSQIADPDLNARDRGRLLALTRKLDCPCGDQAGSLERCAPTCKRSPFALRALVRWIHAGHDNDVVGVFYNDRYRPKDPVQMDLSQTSCQGKANALVTVVVFSDYQCPGCAQAQKFSESLWTDRKTVIRICHKHLPLRNIHPDAQLAAQASVAAQLQGKAEAYHRKLFANQSDLSLAALRRYAADVGLDLPRFDKDLQTASTVKRVTADLAEAERLQLTGTPTYLINGREMTDPLNYTGLREWVDEAAAAAAR